MKHEIKTYLIRQCTNDNCQFRFPAPQHGRLGELCPKCKAPTEIIHELSLEPDIEDDGIHPNKNNNLHLEMLLDNIRSTFNVGAMFRTADGAGIKKLHITGISPLPEHPKVQKTALGAESAIDFEYHPNAVKAVRALKQQGFRLIALEKTGKSIPIENTQLTANQPTVVVVGNEIIGVDPDILALCDQHVHIPMNGIKGSLNVAIAYGIAVYHYLLKS